ncbi:chromosome segregation protein SMC [Aliiruegeria sabulilitoris]|uniref:chromosome segregation protein SMC n=1 Tax=Aliiruegeria sabulilitoris TaxID=1510458 RepID=UPI000835C317|nr:chromosome segregation protein SMC [Aliiruegeria sabulilitoris]NDR59249.1 chromosome segregation protein SMC [Pseudoruegeria sp. M32A2M]
MRFSRLRLNGFKSFVDPTDLVIADGLTGVVGPNGCGKSNLLEALRWVMGENRPTAMRGGGMEDVIFAGAASRPARNFAEVVLSIDNSERLAPSGFNESDVLEVVRRITRDAGSAYKANTRDVRARDIQMLFADASTGSQSPALVRQGQISELINAKPKNRRRVLEEAAGISGLYQRRHEAELKLNGAEQNLSRVDDVVEQLAGQLAQLARQAKQAERYRTIGTDLRKAEGMLLYRRWREAADALEAARAELRERVTAAAKAERLAVEAAGKREKTDAALPALREEEAIAAAVLQRLQVELGAIGEEEARAQESIATLERQILQMSKDIEREAGLNRDAGETISRLAEERGELAVANDGHEEHLAAAVEAARIAASNLQGKESALAELTEDVARLAARHQSAERLEAEATHAVSRHEQEAQKAAGTAAHARSVLEASEEALELAEAGLSEATEAAEAAEDALAEADAARADCAGREAEARAERSGAEGEAQALRAEVAALARLVERDASEGAQVMDHLRIDSGYEKALGAALADDLRAPEIGESDGSGWVALPPYDASQALPEGVPSLADRMDVPEVLRRRMSQVGVVPAEQGARLQPKLKPGQRLVSVEGDLWRWDGLRAAAEDAPSAAALRLQQLNRLVELKRDLEEVSARSEGAAQAHEMLHRQLQDLTEADRRARQARKDADTAVAGASRALSKAENERSMAGARLEAAEMAVARHQEEAAAARERLEEAAEARAELPDLTEERLRIEQAKTEVEGSRRDMMAARAAQDELRRVGEARDRRIKEIQRDIDGWQKRLDNAEARTADLEERKEDAMEQIELARAAPEEIALRREKLAEGLETAEARRRSAADALAAAETVFREAERAERDAEKFASHAREARAASEARAEAARETLEGAVTWIREELETTPEALLETLDADPEEMPATEAIEADIARLRRSRDALGAVNLRAEEDAKEVSAEHGALVEEKRDLEEAIRTLRNGIASLNREGRERLLTAFEEVNGNFRLLFTHLFGGGEAKLELIESDDPLEAGLEIMCMPPGKKLSTLSLLSGGEQTLTAMALIFAVFLANPAPICVLDEVDAPLDDANVTRFCDLLDEMVQRADTRFLIITHHAVTMSRMDRLFGVTMQEQGVSQLVSVDLKKAEALVA